MSSAKLLLSGSLVACGLILGAFALHGYFDPQWQQKQVQAAGRHEPPSEPKAVNAFQTRTRFVSGENIAQDAAPQIVKASVKPGAKSADTKAAAATAAVRRRLAERKKADKEKAEKIAKARQQPQQATLQWPWSWFSN